jgi:hypothetical protein
MAFCIGARGPHVVYGVATGAFDFDGPGAFCQQTSTLPATNLHDCLYKVGPEAVAL